MFGIVSKKVGGLIQSSIGSVQTATTPVATPYNLRRHTLIFITAKFPVRPEHADAWPEISRAFTEATRAEEGCLWFEWSRSLDDSNEYVLVEAFRDGDAGGAHVNSDHFKAAQAELPQYLSATPKVVSQSVDQDDWNELGEMQVD